eukprot:scaffold1342_cov204-Pinguiococcus_pyrenoidosus.AAC.5
MGPTATTPKPEQLGVDSEPVTRDEDDGDRLGSIGIDWDRLGSIGIDRELVSRHRVQLPEDS